jgi:DNA polymerase I-like protein with 3'-5' exonuclease and polymerase domains
MSGPNMQPIPVRTPEGREIRRALIGEISTAASADYTGLEARILARIEAERAVAATRKPV